jgi:phosphate transport system permease protein
MNAATRSRKTLTGILFMTFTGICAFAIIGAVLYVMLDIIIGGLPHVTWEFLTASPEQGMTEGGIYPAIIGTFLLVIIMSMVGCRLGPSRDLSFRICEKPLLFERFIRLAVNTPPIPAIVRPVRAGFSSSSSEPGSTAHFCRRANSCGASRAYCGRA